MPVKKTKQHRAFHVLVAQEPDLSSTRLEFSHVTPKKRRNAAQWEYDSALVSQTLNAALIRSGDPAFNPQKWPAGFVSLAIDPLYAPALLTVGCIDYQHGFVKEAMDTFLTLTTFPEAEEDLAELIDKAGNFLLDEEDYENALSLWLAAEAAYPTQAIHYVGSGYCYHKLGNSEESIRKERKAVELEPDNYLHLNDLGYGLLEAGQFEEAESLLKRSISLAPPDYEFAKNNLKYLYEKKIELKTTSGKRNSRGSKAE